MGGMNAMSAVAVAVALVSSALAAGAMVDVDGGLTLGDLDRMDGRGFPGADPFGASVHGRTFAPLDGGDADPTDEPSGKRGLGRIHLDLSGRVMCHVLSPGSPGDREDRARHGGAPPLFSLQDGLQSGPQAKSKRARRLVPGVHLGADYDLDEVWYGATRWLARLSWGPFCVFRNNEKPGDENGILAVARRRLSASSLCNSPLAIDLEGERSVFDPRDRTTRLRIDRVMPHSSSAAKLSRMKGLASTDGRLTVEYDSAKYTDEADGVGPVLFAPKITTDVRLPLLFNSRVEVRSRRSWIIQDGGDGDGNYYAGRHLGGISPAASLLEHVREGYRQSVPRGARREGGGPGDERLGIGGRVNRWLEEDGWAPKRVSTDLLGNLRSVSEVGLAGGASPSTRRPPRRIRGPFHASGLRLRVSRRIGWSSLGIFPWSKNSGGDAGPSLTDALGGTGVGLELRGLNGDCDGVTSFAIVVADAAEWRDSTRFVLARESIAIAGSR